MIKINSAQTRAGLLASTALLAMPGVAHAQSDGRPVSSVEDPHSNAVSSAAPAGRADISLENTVETPNITINNNFTTTEARDPNNITGIGQIVTDGGGGSVGLCTGTLINPRTVIFAAHCVNTRAATAYGANSGGVGAAVAFETNTRANAAGQPDELVNWLLGSGQGPGRFQTNRAQQLYNMNQVFWNPLSTQNASCTSATSCFLEADIATGVLDAPTRNVPTWTMLFSPLATPGAINPATGTGYHVSIAGYGAFGNGTTGQASGSDFRRRTAENMLGALTSLNARNLFLFGTTGSPSRPQQLYWLDFDDPRRGQAGADPEDFNGFRDNALPREGLTGPGDSGGPLILDTFFSRPTILGVLSGGSTFFTGQPGGSYGTQSFYQPLFLYWDWIVANNPYRYVTATAGNKNWEDATAWVTELDPSYQILLNGQLTNGLPTNLGGGRNATGPQFGELCFQSPSSSPNPVNNECQNLTTGATRNNVPNTPTGTGDFSSPANVAIVEGDAAQAAALGSATDMASRGLDGAFEAAHADPGYSDTVRPAPTLANGLPGATNFTPNNVDGVRSTGTLGRYYDVTLRNAGIVTLNSAVTIDRFTVAGAQSQLTVATGATLNSLIDTNQVTGIVNVNGTLNSGGDYFFMSGLLSGTGRINAPFLTSVMGNFAPGTVGTTGTLTIGGNVVMASGSTYAVDLGANGVSDRLAVVAGAGNAGTANLGGRVVFSPVTGSIIRNNDTYTILTAAGGVTGTFTAPTAISAILTPVLSYSANAVTVRIAAAAFNSIPLTSANQRAFATLLDANRSNPNFAGGQQIFDYLDLQNLATIQATLESWTPRTESLVGGIGTVMTDNITRMFSARAGNLDVGGDYDGSVAMVGAPLSIMAMGNTAGMTMASMQSGTVVAPQRLPDGVRGFIAGGYLDGETRSGIAVGADDKLDGWYVAAGVEARASENSVVGFGLSYTKGDGTTAGIAQRVRADHYQGTLYGKVQTDGGLEIDAMLSAGRLSVKTRRAAALGATTFDLRSQDNTLAIASEVGVGKFFGEGLKFGPRVAFRSSNVGFTPTIETGGPMALFYDRGDYNSAQGLLGLVVKGQAGAVRPYASAYAVHEFLDRPNASVVNFVGGVGPGATFALAGQDRNWFEAGLGLSFGGENVEFAVGADTTLMRKDVSNQSYRGSVTFRF